MKSKFLAIMFVLISFNSSSSELVNSRKESAKVCKAAISTIMGRSPSIISTQTSKKDHITLHYIRPSDGSRWSYRCKIKGNRILWSSKNGRWRDHPNDPKLSFSITQNEVTIVELYSDGSKLKKSFTTKELE